MGATAGKGVEPPERPGGTQYQQKQGKKVCKTFCGPIVASVYCYCLLVTKSVLGKALLTAPDRSKNEGERIVDRKNNPVNSVALVRLSMIVGVVAVPQQQS